VAGARVAAENAFSLQRTNCRLHVTGVVQGTFSAMTVCQYDKPGSAFRIFPANQVVHLPGPN